VADESQKKKKVRCSTPGSDECVDKCEGIGAYCAHLAVHPYSPSSGNGQLYQCTADGSSWTCSYQYSNGDTCTKIMPGSFWLCAYPH
jgi:hypothetical protein